MASFTFSSCADQFPVGTSVSAYLAKYRKDGTSPSGSATDTATVASAGTLTFDDLADDTKYVAYASVNGQHRYRSFSTDRPRRRPLEVIGDPTDSDAPVYESAAAGYAATPVVRRVTSTDSMRDLTPVAGVTYYLAATGKEGPWRYDSSDTTSTDNEGTIVVTDGGHRMKRVFTGGVRPEWFGAKGDVVDSTATLITGTDDTDAFQDAIDYILDSGASSLDLTSRYRIDGTLYVNQSTALTAQPFTIRGLTGNPCASRGRGSAIIRRVTGDIFRVNLDSGGSAALDTATDQFFQFSVENVSFIGKSASGTTVVTGINAIKAFRTRCVLRNVYSSRVDYLMLQEDDDADAVENYCDHSIYDNLRIEFSTLGGVRLVRPDATLVKGFAFNYPLSTVEHGLEINYGDGCSVEGVLAYQSAGTYSPVAGSSLVKVANSKGIRLGVMHVERPLNFEVCFDVSSSKNVTFHTLHTKFDSETIFKTTSSTDVKIDGWFGWHGLGGGEYDINISGGSNENVSWQNVYLYGGHPSTTPRAVSVTGTAANTTYAMDGAQREPYTVLTDADATLRAENTYQLPAITADRTVTLPTVTKDNAEIVLVNRNTSTTYLWNVGGGLARKANGTNFTVVPFGMTVVLRSHLSSLVWRVVAISTAEQIDGAHKVAVATKTADYTITSADRMVMVDSTSGVTTITLPSAASSIGRMFTVKKIAGGNNVSVARAGSDTIDGATSVTLADQYDSVTLVGRGNTEFAVVASVGI